MAGRKTERRKKFFLFPREESRRAVVVGLTVAEPPVAAASAFEGHAKAAAAAKAWVDEIELSANIAAVGERETG